MNQEALTSTGEAIALTLSYIFVVALLAVWIGGWLFRSRLSDRVRLTLCGATTVLILAILLTYTYAHHATEYIQHGTRSRSLELQVDALEQTFSSPGRLSKSKEPYSIIVLGDSTHYHNLEPREEFLSLLKNALHEELRSKISMRGLRHQGFDAFDYYFLLNWLVDHEPNMIIIPINLRTFGPLWTETDRTGFPVLERYIRWREIPRASYLSYSSRIIRWDLLAMRKLDFAITNRKGIQFFRGIKLQFDDRLAQFESRFEMRYRDSGSYIPDTWLDRKEQFFATHSKIYAKSIPIDHPMIRAFRAINRLMHEHGVQVVYYSVELARKDVDQELHYELIRNILVQDPNVRFVDTLGLVNKSHFMQGEHLTPEGINLLTRYLAPEIGSIIQDKNGLSDIDYELIEKGEYIPATEPEKIDYETQVDLLEFLDKVNGFSADELEAFLLTLEPQFVQPTIDAWEKKYGPRP